MDRKGDMSTPLFVNLFDLIIVGMVLAALLVYVGNYEDSLILEKNYLARDIALMIDTSYSVPYHMSERYDPKSIDLMSFEMSFRGTNFQVQEARGKKMRIYYPFGKDMAIDSSLPKLSDTRHLYFNKAPDYFSIAPSIEEPQSSCPDPDTSADMDTRHVAVISGDADVWKDAAFDDEDVMDTIIGNLEDSGLDLSGKDDADMVIELVPGSADPSVFPVHAYYHLDDQYNRESRKLACMLAQAFTVSDYMVDSRIEGMSGTAGNVYVKLVVGNVNIDKKIGSEQVYYPGVDKITQSLKKTIVDYYG